MTDGEVWSRPQIVAHSALLLGSFRRIVGRELIAPTGDAQADARALFSAAFAVLSHGVEEDPVLNYGNAAALRLWEMDFAAFTRMPSRLTAEPMLREDRQRLLATAARRGYVDDYAGVRISRSGRRFRIENVILWSLVDEAGTKRGQAAVFDRWQLLS